MSLLPVRLGCTVGLTPAGTHLERLHCPQRRPPQLCRKGLLQVRPARTHLPRLYCSRYERSDGYGHDSGPNQPGPTICTHSCSLGRVRSTKTPFITKLPNDISPQFDLAYEPFFLVSLISILQKVPLIPRVVPASCTLLFLQSFAGNQCSYRGYEWSKETGECT